MKHYRYDFNVTVEEFYFTVGSLCTAADSDSHMVFALIHPQGLRGKHGVRRSELEWQHQEEMDIVTKKKSAEYLQMLQNINNCPSTWTLKCFIGEMTNWTVVHNHKHASILFLRIQRKWFLWNCVVGHEAVNSTRGFHSMQSLPPCPLGLYYILLHSGRKKKQKTTHWQEISTWALQPLQHWYPAATAVLSHNDRPKNKSGL